MSDESDESDESDGVDGVEQVDAGAWSNLSDPSKSSGVQASACLVRLCSEVLEYRLQPVSSDSVQKFWSIGFSLSRPTLSDWSDSSDPSDWSDWSDPSDWSDWSDPSDKHSRSVGVEAFDASL